MAKWQAVALAKKLQQIASVHLNLLHNLNLLNNTLRNAVFLKSYLGLNFLPIPIYHDFG